MNKQTKISSKLSLTCAMLVAGISANAEIVLSDSLSLSGYIDMGASDFDSPSGTDSFSADLYEVELALSFTSENISAVAELSYRPNDIMGTQDSDVVFETVTITYAVNDELSFTAGNMLSYLGWETYDSTGLYQISYAYRGFSPLYPAYAVGASVDYVTDMFSVGVWVGEGTSLGGDGERVSYEIAGKFTGVENLTIFAGYANDPWYETYNVWASYEVADLTFALEYIYTDLPGGADTKGYLAMVNYAMGDFGITGRYSIQDDSFMATDWELLTVSPSYAFTDNFLALAELSYILDGGFGTDWVWGVELIYTF